MSIKSIKVWGLCLLVLSVPTIVAASIFNVPSALSLAAAIVFDIGMLAMIIVGIRSFERESGRISHE